MTAFVDTARGSQTDLRTLLLVAFVTTTPNVHLPKRLKVWART